MPRLGELFVASGLLTSEQVEQALRAQVMWGGRLGTNLIELGFMDLDALSRGLGRQHRLPAALAKHFDKADPAIQQLLSPDFAERFSCVPLLRAGPERKVVIVSIAPLEKKPLAIIADELGVEPTQLIPSIAAELRIRYHLERVYNIPRGTRFLRSRGKTNPPFRAFEVAPVAPDSDPDIRLPSDTQHPAVQAPEPVPAKPALPKPAEARPEPEPAPARVEPEAAPPKAEAASRLAPAPAPGKEVARTPAQPLAKPLAKPVAKPVAKPADKPPAIKPAAESSPPAKAEGPAPRSLPSLPSLPSVAARPGAVRPISVPSIPSIVRAPAPAPPPPPPPPPPEPSPGAAEPPPIAADDDLPVPAKIILDLEPESEPLSDSEPIFKQPPTEENLGLDDGWSSVVVIDEEDMLAVPKAAIEDEASGRERRRYIPTLGDEPATDSERAALARIAIRRVKLPSNPPQTGSTLGEATRAIRRGLDRDKVAALVVSSLDRFMPQIESALLLVVRGEVAIGWKGFARNGDALPEIAIPMDPIGLIPTVCSRNTTTRSRSSDLGPIDQLLLAALGGHTGDLVGVPVSISDQVMCVIAMVTPHGAEIASVESIAAAMGAAFARLMRDASR